MKTTRLFTRVLVLLAGLFVLAAASSGGVAAWNLERTLSEEHRVRGRAIADNIAEASIDPLLNRDPATIQAMVDQYRETSGIAYIFVTDARGEIVTHTFAPVIPPEVHNLP